MTVEMVVPLVAGLAFGTAVALAVVVLGQRGRIEQLERELRSVRRRVMFVEDRTVLGMREVAR